MNSIVFLRSDAAPQHRRQPSSGGDCEEARRSGGVALKGVLEAQRQRRPRPVRRVVVGGQVVVVPVQEPGRLRMDRVLTVEWKPFKDTDDEECNDYKKKHTDMFTKCRKAV